MSLTKEELSLDNPNLSPRQIKYRKNRDKVLEKAKLFRMLNREKLAQRQREYRMNFPERVHESVAKYAPKHRLEARERSRIWREKNRAKKPKKPPQPDYDMAYGRAYNRAFKKGATAPTVNRKIAGVFYEAAIRLSKILGIRFAVDHIVPFKSGGKHHHANLQYMPYRLNAIKGERHFSNPIWSSPEFSLSIRPEEPPFFVA